MWGHPRRRTDRHTCPAGSNGSARPSSHTGARWTLGTASVPVAGGTIPSMMSRSLVALGRLGVFRMPGKVFISCGQATSEERHAARSRGHQSVGCTRCGRLARRRPGRSAYGAPLSARNLPRYLQGAHQGLAVFPAGTVASPLFHAPGAFPKPAKRGLLYLDSGGLAMLRSTYATHLRRREPIAPRCHRLAAPTPTLVAGSGGCSDLTAPTTRAAQ